MQLKLKRYVCIRYSAPCVLGRVGKFVIKAREQGKSRGSCHIKKKKIEHQSLI